MVIAYWSYVCVKERTSERERGEEKSGVRGRQKERESGSKLFALIIYFIMCEQNTHFQPEKEKSMHINIKQIRRHRNTLFNWCKCWQIFKCLCACVSPFPLWKTKSNQIRLLQYMCNVFDCVCHHFWQHMTFIWHVCHFHHFKIKIISWLIKFKFESAKK